jgi:hypothetical protein
VSLETSPFNLLDLPESMPHKKLKSCIMAVEVAMFRTINLTTEVPPNREVRIQLPDDIPPGPAEMVVVVASHTATTGHTLGDLARSEFFGMWRDRSDIGDTAEFARRLRRDAWSRPA